MEEVREEKYCLTPDYKIKAGKMIAKYFEKGTARSVQHIFNSDFE